VPHAPAQLKAPLESQSRSDTAWLALRSAPAADASIGRASRTLRETPIGVSITAALNFVLRLRDELSVARAVMATGVDGFVLKMASATDLLDAVAAVVRGHTYIALGIRVFPTA
jgi:hypothetical protein